MAPNGTATIVGMRRDLLILVRQHPHLASIDADMKHLLSSWFNRGFLSLEQINWETPAIILEKLIEHETVHQSFHGVPQTALQRLSREQPLMTHCALLQNAMKALNPSI